MLISILPARVWERSEIITHWYATYPADDDRAHRTEGDEKKTADGSSWIGDRRMTRIPFAFRVIASIERRRLKLRHFFWYLFHMATSDRSSSREIHRLIEQKIYLSLLFTSPPLSLWDLPTDKSVQKEFMRFTIYCLLLWTLWAKRAFGMNWIKISSSHTPQCELKFNEGYRCGIAQRGRIDSIKVTPERAMFRQ